MSMERSNPSGATAVGGSHIPKLPILYGEDAYLWVTRVEKYFHANPTNDRDKLRAATAALEGPAFDWYQNWRMYTDVSPTWSSFKDAVVQHFQPEAATNPYGVLLNLRQAGTVAEYRELFETLTHSEPLRNLSADQISGAVFVNGLSDELREKLRLQKADSLSDLMRKAQLIEEKKRAEGDGPDTRPGPKARPLMKFRGEIAGRKVVILVADSSCNSLIAKGVVKELGLPMCGTHARFQPALGGEVKAVGVCRGVVVKVHEGVEITQDFFVFDRLIAEDLVLGFDCTQRLGKFVESFRDLTIQFEVAGRAITVKGDPSLTAPDEFRVSAMWRVK